MSFEKLLPLINKTGSNLSPKAFQERINIVFHNHEAVHYDKLHSDMRESLQEQINFLVNDLLSSDIAILKNLKLLDIGAGTGLSTQMLLNSKIGCHINSITLLDTSINMLKHAEEKAKTWNKEYKIVNADINFLSEKFDIILICSVLHHIPELSTFLKKVDKLLNSGGILIHLQDPNGDNLKNEKYLSNVKEYNNRVKLNSKKISIKKMIPKKWKHYINRVIGRKTYIDFVNDQLIKENIIKYRMSADEIWSVTDIHVESEFNNDNAGVSLKFLKGQLVNYKLINQRSYGFYGLLKNELLLEYKIKEDELMHNNSLFGRNISCIWIKD